MSRPRKALPVLGQSMAPVAVGLDYRAGLLPKQKVEAVRGLVNRYGSAEMVGDGVNDAPALAASSVSFAMGAAGTDVALWAAVLADMGTSLAVTTNGLRLFRRDR